MFLGLGFSKSARIAARRRLSSASCVNAGGGFAWSGRPCNAPQWPNDREAVRFDSRIWEAGRLQNSGEDGGHF